MGMGNSGGLSVQLGCEVMKIKNSCGVGLISALPTSVAQLFWFCYKFCPFTRAGISFRLVLSKLVSVFANFDLLALDRVFSQAPSNFRPSLLALSLKMAMPYCDQVVSS